MDKLHHTCMYIHVCTKYMQMKCEGSQSLSVTSVDTSTSISVVPSTDNGNVSVNHVSTHISVTN